MIPSLNYRIENVLQEARMLLLGGQVLLGFGYRACFEQGFDRIPTSARLAQLSGLGVMTVGLGWLLWPAAFHQIAERGRETETIERFTTRILDWALLAFALGMGLSFYPASCALHIPFPGKIGVAVGAFAVAMWYGGVFSQSRLARLRRPNVPYKQEHESGKGSDLPNRIKKVLIECRMALPGAQAFLGFQFAIVFVQGFEQLPRSSQLIHFTSLLATTVSIVLLIAPAAYHRLVEGGQDTEKFHTVASIFLIAALVFLAPGMAGDLFVVMRKVTGSEALSAGIAGMLLIVFYLLWFGVSVWRRKPA